MAFRELGPALFFESEFSVEGRTFNTISAVLRATDPLAVAALQRDTGRSDNLAMKTMAVTVYFALVRQRRPDMDEISQTVDQVLNVASAKKASDVITGPASPQWEVPVYIVTWASKDRLS